MKIFRRVLFGIFSVVDIYLLYSWIGYLVLGINHPVIYGKTNTTFTGMYIMSATFFCLFAILTTILTICFVNFIKKRKSTNNN